MAEVLLISQKDVKRNSIIDGSVDSDKFLQYIKLAQDKHIQQYLGTDLIEALQTKTIDGSFIPAGGTGQFEETYGENIISNGNFEDGLTGWSAGSGANLSVENNRLIIQGDNDFNMYARTTATFEQGVDYKVFLDIHSGTTSNVKTSVFSEGVIVDEPFFTGLKTFDFTPTTANSTIPVDVTNFADDGAGDTLVINEFAIKKIILTEIPSLDISEENQRYKDLISKYIKPMLIYWTLVEYYPFASYELSNKGILKHTSESSETINQEELSNLINNTRSTAKYYTDRFKDYICNNSSLFPEYSSNTKEDVTPKRSGSGINWVL